MTVQFPHRSESHQLEETSVRYIRNALPRGWTCEKTYTSAWSLRLNPDEPLESIAYKSLVSYPLVSCVSLNKRIDLITRAVRDYKIDGAILHSNRSCRPISMGQMDIGRVLADELSVPSVMFDGDHMDGEKFSMAQFQTRIDALMEMILEKKRAS